MIVDCHGHYTTAPAGLQAYRQAQIAALTDPTLPRTPRPPEIFDDEISASLEGAQLKFSRERGTDVTIFSPRASAMAHHVGDQRTSLDWARECNDLIARVCALYPANFVGVAQLPQSPGADLTASIANSNAPSASSASLGSISIPIRRADIGRRRRSPIGSGIRFMRRWSNSMSRRWCT